MRLVIPSVLYADYLAVTLPAWQRALPNARITVVTSPGDRDTQRVAAEAGVRVLATDVWTEKGAILNKGGALDEAFGFLEQDRRRPSIGERCISVDADVYPFGRFDPNAIELNVLYGCVRYDCRTPEDLEAHRSGQVPREALTLLRPRVKGESAGGPIVQPTSAQITKASKHCLGYFQLFRYRRGLRFGHSLTAGKYDLKFRHHFSRRDGLKDFYVLHLGEQTRANWKGRVVPPWPAGGADAGAKFEPGAIVEPTMPAEVQASDARTQSEDVDPLHPLSDDGLPKDQECDPV